MQVLLGSMDHLQADQLVSALLEAGRDLGNQAALDTVWLDSDEGTLGGRHLQIVLFD